MSEPAISLLIVDDHPIVRDGLRGMLAGDARFDVVGEAADGSRAVEMARSLDPDVVLMDLRMPGSDGVTAIRRMSQLGLRSRVLVLTTYATESEVLPAIEAGATGYLLKDAPLIDLIRAIEAAARGEAVLAPAAATVLIGKVRHPDPVLSDRELEVLRLVADGSTNRDIATRLFISEATVKSHLLHLYDKFGVNDRAAAVAVGFQRHLLV